MRMPILIVALRSGRGRLPAAPLLLAGLALAFAPPASANGVPPTCDDGDVCTQDRCAPQPGDRSVRELTRIRCVAISSLSLKVISDDSSTSFKRKPAKQDVSIEDTPPVACADVLPADPLHRAGAAALEEHRRAADVADVERDAFRQGAAILGVPSNTWVVIP